MNGKYKIVIIKAAQRDKEKIKAIPTLKKRVDEFLNILRENPYQNPPPYEKLQGNFKGAYSRRINRQHRLIYTVDEGKKTVKIFAMWTHYE